MVPPRIVRRIDLALASEALVASGSTDSLRAPMQDVRRARFRKEEEKHDEHGRCEPCHHPNLPPPPLCRRHEATDNRSKHRTEYAKESEKNKPICGASRVIQIRNRAPTRRQRRTAEEPRQDAKHEQHAHIHREARRHL